MRVRPGIFTEMSFGAAVGSLIEIDLTSAAFTANGQPSEALSAGLAQLLRSVADTPSVVHITYYRISESTQTARARLTSTAALIQNLWAQIGSYDMIIERAVARFD